MSKAFSLLEIIIAILVITIILSFAISKYENVLESSNFVKLKSQYSLIKASISKVKRKNILLARNEEITSLDDASSLVENQILFSKVIDFKILSTNNSLKQKGSWLKQSENSYVFFLNKEVKVEFLLKDSTFTCVNPKSICMELE